jgi:hypothetical protein
MSNCRASLDYKLFGLRTLILENDSIRTTIMLDRGANFYEFILKKANKDLLFHHPRVKPRAPVLGALAGIDNWWYGGIDEILPTAFFSTYRGDEYPIIGELWTQTYTCDLLTQTPDEVSAYLSTNTIISPFKIEKWVTLRGDESRVTVRTKITNTGYRDFHFLWGYHCTFAVTPDHRIDMPASKMLVEDMLDSRFKAGSEYTWPTATDKNGKTYDLSKVLDSSALMYEYHYATELSDGWLAVTDTKKQTGMGVAFPKEILSKIHLWLNYGIWRNCYNVGLYPLTGYPAAFHKAAEQGTCSRLDPGQSLDCEVSFVAYSGVSQVKRIDRNGKVS